MKDESYGVDEGRCDPTGASSIVTGSPAGAEGTDEMKSEVLFILFVILK
jgi:hypothetical protein